METDQLPICSARSIVASASAGQQVRRKTYYNCWLLLGLHDRSSAAEKKEGQGCIVPVDRGNVAPAALRTDSAARPGRLYSINWLVWTLSTAHRTSLWTSMATACYVAPGLVPCRRARLPSSDPRAKQATSSMGPSSRQQTIPLMQFGTVFNYCLSTS